MGKTDKEKAKEKDKDKAKAATKDKVPKALRPSGDGAKRKKWSKSKQKEKLNNAVFWTKPLHAKLIKDIIGKEPYVTTSMVSDNPIGPVGPKHVLQHFLFLLIMSNILCSSQLFINSLL